MSTWGWIVIAIVVALAVAVAIAAYIARKNQTKRLQERFGSEYDRTVSTRGEQRSAEKELVERERKREQLDIVPLTPEARDKYAESWRRCPDALRRRPAGCGRRRRPARDGRPAGTRLPDRRVRPACRRHLGRPSGRGRELSRGARDLPEQQQNGGGGTEDLRQAFVHYRALFEELLETREPAGQEAR